MKEGDVYFLVSLIGNLAYKWFQICRKCGLRENELDTIGVDTVNTKSGPTICLAMGLTKWCKTCSKPKVDILIKALRSIGGQCRAVAEKISKECNNLPSVKAIGKCNNYKMSSILG